MRKHLLYSIVLLISVTGCSSELKRSDKATVPAPKPTEKVMDYPDSTAATVDAEQKSAESKLTEVKPEAMLTHKSEAAQAQTEPATLPAAEKATATAATNFDSGLCKTGKMQSPVNLKWSKPLASGGDVQLNYKPTPLKMIDNGLTLVAITEDAGSANLHGEDFKLTQVEFRTPSEHQLSGNSLPLEAQFVHKNKKGDLAILSVILIEGAENPEVGKIWSMWPTTKNAETEVKNSEFNPMVLLPRKMTHYSYRGSLTVPPCTEGVKWFVLNTPVEVSKNQIVGFRSHYSSNARPVQALKGRKVTNY